MVSVKRKCCPVCGGKITVSYLYQTSHDYVVTKSGKLSKRFKKTDEAPMEVAIAGCRACGAYWDAEQFFIDEKDCFWDEKYTEL